MSLPNCARSMQSHATNSIVWSHKELRAIVPVGVNGGGHLPPTQIFCNFISHVVRCRRGTERSTLILDDVKSRQRELHQTSPPHSHGVCGRQDDTEIM